MITGERRLWLIAIAIVAAGTAVAGCQRPTDPDDVVEWDDVVTVAAAPDPILADTLTGGRTYRVVRGNNQPDEILPYDWHAVFSATVNLTDLATDEDVDLDFPVRITSTTLAVKQASGGIVTPPTGGDVEKYDFITLGATGNQLSAVNSPVTLTFEVWYDLPSLRKEAVVTVTFAFVDNDGTSFQRSADLRVAP
jgi:hypothetical protein